jgi:hypothetical protein
VDVTDTTRLNGSVAVSQTNWASAARGGGAPLADPAGTAVLAKPAINATKVSTLPVMRFVTTGWARSCSGPAAPYVIV